MDNCGKSRANKALLASTIENLPENQNILKGLLYKW